MWKHQLTYSACLRTVGGNWSTLEETDQAWGENENFTHTAPKARLEPLDPGGVTPLDHPKIV